MATTYDTETHIPYRTPFSHSDVVYNLLASTVGFKANYDTRYLISRVVQSVGNSLGGLALIDEEQLQAVAYTPDSLMDLAVKLGVNLMNQAWTGDALTDARIIYTEVVLKVARALLEVGGDEEGMDEYGYEDEERMVDSDYESDTSTLVDAEAHAEIDWPTGTITPEDGYYGLEDHAKMCARFIERLFPCSDVGLAVSQPESTIGPTLARFIAHILHRAKIPGAVPFYALLLLSRLQRHFPALIASGHSLFVSAMMISAKLMCDITYTNKSWCGITGNLFELEDLNRMEWEMCTRLEWRINVDPEELEVFEERVANEYCSGLGESDWVAAGSSPVVSDRNPCDSPRWAPCSPEFPCAFDSDPSLPVHDSPKESSSSPPFPTLAYPSPPWSDDEMATANNYEETEMEWVEEETWLVD